MRPHEYRLAVIRRAAIHRASRLAEQQLSAPTYQVGLQLARVATSAYRLLDPRRRHDQSHRAVVGRVLPQSFSWAGRSGFVFGEVSELVSASLEVASVPFERALRSDAELIEMLELDLPVGARRQRSWDFKTDQFEVDSVNPTPAMRRAARWAKRRTFRTRSRSRLALHLTVVLASACCALAILTVYQSSNRETSNAATVAETSSSVRKSADDEAANSRLEGAITLLSDGSRPSREITSDSERSLRGVMEVDPAVVPALTPEPSGIAASSMSDDGVGATDLVEQEVDHAGSTLNPLPSAVAVEGGREASPQMVQTFQAVPRSSVRELAALEPSLESRFDSDRARTRIQQLQSALSKFEPGSSEHMHLLTQICEAAWLIETFAEVERRANAVSQLYEITSVDLLTSTFETAARSASLPSTHTHLTQNGLRLADHLLLASSPGHCRQVLDAMQSLDFPIGDKDEALARWLQDCDDAIEIMSRQAEVVDRGIWAPESLGASEAIVLGRHLCLMLRRWEVGLRWLTESADPRLALAAQGESQLDQLSSVREWSNVAELWLIAAASEQGRPADSMRLHAIDLLKQAQSHSAGLERLQIDRRIAKISAEVPPHLQPVQHSRFNRL